MREGRSGQGNVRSCGRRGFGLYCNIAILRRCSNGSGSNELRENWGEGILAKNKMTSIVILQYYVDAVIIIVSEFFQHQRRKKLEQEKGVQSFSIVILQYYVDTMISLFIATNGCCICLNVIDYLEHLNIPYCHFDSIFRKCGHR